MSPQAAGGTPGSQSGAGFGGHFPLDLGSGDASSGPIPGIPIPEEDGPQSYRPPIHLLPDDYFRGFTHGRYQLNARAPLPLGVSPPSSYQPKAAAQTQPGYGMGRGGYGSGKGRGQSRSSRGQNRPRSWGNEGEPGAGRGQWV